MFSFHLKLYLIFCFIVIAAFNSKFLINRTSNNIYSVVGFLF